MVRAIAQRVTMQAVVFVRLTAYLWNAGGDGMSAGKRRGCLRNLILCVLVITALIIQLEKNLSQTLLDMAFARAYSMAVETLNSAVHQVMETGVSYEELMDTQLDAQGRVSMLRANTMRMNALAAQTALLAEQKLNSDENQVVDIPLGAAMGVRSLSGYGPRISVQIVPVGAVNTGYDTEFETAGINQTRHKIFLTLRATVSLIIPTGSQVVEVQTTMPIAESIIVGEVPDSFVDVSNPDDMLDLLP